MAPSTRNQQPYVRGLGKLYQTPKKKRRGHPANQAPVQFLGRELQIQALRRRLHGLLHVGDGAVGSQTHAIMEGSSSDIQDIADRTLGPLDDGSDAPLSSDIPDPPLATTEPDVRSPPRKKRRRQPAAVVVNRLYGRWKDILPCIVPPLLEYLQRSAGLPVATTFQPVHMCRTVTCTMKQQDITLLFWDHYENARVPFCECTPLPLVLVASGMFPTAPTQPRLAVSIDLLDLYSALFERSGDAVTALARALRRFYTRRGWRVLDNSGAPISDPFRKPLGRAMQWYDSVRILVERGIEAAVETARSRVQDHLSSQSPTCQPTSSNPDWVDTEALRSAHPSTSAAESLGIDGSLSVTSRTTTELNGYPPNDPGPCTIGSPNPNHTGPPPSVPAASISPFQCTSQPESDIPSSTSGSEQVKPQHRTCAPILQRRCPACFGGDAFGRSFAQGADIIVAIDGNFSHRHLRTAGDGPAFHDPEYFISKAEVDAIGSFIETQRKKPPSKTFVPKVPDAAIDSCQHGHEAANEQKAKTNGDRFDDTGIMALVCSHDIPIFMANIDTPGEQQKYALALVTHLFGLLPEDATVAALYDIGCTVDRSVGLYDLLPSNITERLMWAISVMHAYGHEWSCQLVYNPRLRPGLGLRDGEGVERLWSRLRVFVPVTRTSGRSRRIWLLDRQLSAIADEMRDNLGAWITRKLKNGVWDQYTAAKAIVIEVKINVIELRRQWAMQQEAQLSIRAHAPARLKKEVDAVLSLQAEIERVENALEAVRNQFQASQSSSECIAILSNLVRTSEDLGKRAESLYSSLNITEIFPELNGLPADFVRMLVLARDIKINIRKRVTAQLLEFDRIDRAAGGKDNPLGTRLHQHTRKSIARRQPAILTAIRKFNKYCTAIQEIAANNPIPSSIPIPRPLSTDLSVLREHPDLYEDVWVYSPTPQETPRWLEDADMRKAIRALLKMERCAEEEIRLQREVDNLCWWFGREMAATELALRDSANALYLPLLQQRFDSVALLQCLWENPLDAVGRLTCQAAWASHIVYEILGLQDTSSAPSDRPVPSSQHFPVLDEDDDEDSADIFGTTDGLDPPEIIDTLEDIEFADEAEDEEDGGCEGIDEPDALRDTVSSNEIRDGEGAQYEVVDEPDAVLDAVRNIILGDEDPYPIGHDAPNVDVEGYHEHPDTVDVTQKGHDAASSSVTIRERHRVACNTVGIKAGQLYPPPIDPVAVEDRPLQVRFSWESPGSLAFDTFPALAAAQFPAHSLHIPLTRVLPRTATSVSISISPADYHRLANPSGLLNSDCINSCGVLLQHALATSGTRRCAIFSTWDVDTAALSNDGGALARSTRHTSFWERDIWLVPIHRPGSDDQVGHWTLVIVDIAKRILLHFDSFADRMLWRDDICRVAQLITRIFRLAAVPTPSGEWQALPLLTTSVQTNGSDCGIWILAVIAAQLRGFDTTALREDDIPDFRKYLCHLVTKLGETR